MLISKVTSFISIHKLISPGDHIIAAVSGGADSVAMLYLLNDLKKTQNFKLSVFHLNHGIRDKESDNDEIFVAHLSESMGVECSIQRLSGFTKESGENALRNARYKKFEEELSKFKNSKIATAHHLNDQLETFIMRMFKGSGTRGLLGIPAIRGKYIRPMLSCSKQEILDFCKSGRFEFREDSTNFEEDKLRNNIRKNITPLLGQIFGSDYLDSFNQAFENYKILYTEYCNKNIHGFAKIISKNKNNVSCKAEDYLHLTDFQKSQFLEYCFSYAYQLNFNFSNEHIKEFSQFVKNAGSGAVFKFDASIFVLKNRELFTFYKSENNAIIFRELYAGENVNFGHYSIGLKKVDRNVVKFSNNKNVEFICGDSLDLPLIIRNWKYGDSFYPIGSKGRQKLSDFFVNNKVDKIQKTKIPIITTKNKIVWIAGMRLDGRFKVDDKTKIIYRIELKYDDTK
ncbi:MAG: tRNA lysidine(34) synthetase TilS [Calditrichae bacterium]|nr:tRNA lysidine(34) synthetase TilS [Calditrichota bacterium]MCB9058872.1 tRNA lysidine(34) synthetase TilS [Calditrichia bacterium]